LTLGNLTGADLRDGLAGAGLAGAGLAPAPEPARARLCFSAAMRSTTLSRLGVSVASGAVPSPFDCWLILRGMRTLPWRMRAHSENAAKVAEFLAGHRNVERVHYPGLSSHPGHKIAQKQMSMFGGMLSFEVKGGREPAMKVTTSTKIFTRATSLGGVESLIEHRASIEGPTTRAPESLLRLSVGLEHPDDLIADLDQALG